MRIPARLRRNGVKEFFTKVSREKWDYWFKNERKNGLRDLRVKGPFERAYCSGEGLKQWLVSEGHYSPRDFDTSPPPRDWLSPVKQQLAA